MQKVKNCPQGRTIFDVWTNRHHYYFETLSRGHFKCRWVKILTQEKQFFLSSYLSEIRWLFHVYNLVHCDYALLSISITRWQCCHTKQQWQPQSPWECKWGQGRKLFRYSSQSVAINGHSSEMAFWPEIPSKSMSVWVRTLGGKLHNVFDLISLI